MTTAYGVLLLQCASLIVLSVHIFNRFNVGIDFADFSSAWTEIGQGHLNSSSTISGFPYVQNHFELIMWPLALLYPLCHSSFVLLVLQDVSIAGTNLVVLSWVLAIAKRQDLSDRMHLLTVVLTALALLLNPEVYQTVALDFHFEPTAVFFAVLAGYELWAGHHRRYWIWFLLCLSCGDIGGIYVIGVGLSALLAGAKTRVTGVLTMLGGIAWIALISSLGANKGSLVSAGYAYLAGRPGLSSGVGGLLLIVGGALTHPSRPWHVISGRLDLIVGYLRPVGVLGIASAWGFGVPAITLFTSSIQYSPLFIETPFQEFAVYPFALIGLVILAPRMWSFMTQRKIYAWLGGVLAVAAVASALLFDAFQLPPSPHKNAENNFNPPAEAAVLHRGLSLTSANAEVVASVPVMGRFGARQFIYPFDHAGRAVPLRASTVVLVVDEPHPTALMTIPDIASAVTYVRSTLNGRVLASGDGVFVVEWHPKRDVNAVRLP